MKTNLSSLMNVVAEGASGDTEGWGACWKNPEEGEEF